MNQTFSKMHIDNIIAYATSNRGGGYSFKLTRDFDVQRILDELHKDTWRVAALRSAFFIKGPLYKVSTKKELVQRVYEETLKLTGSGFTATNIPVYLFDEKKGRWQVTLPKWSTGSNAGRFRDRVYLSGVCGLHYGR